MGWRQGIPADSILIADIRHPDIRHPGDSTLIVRL
jgi:hypothetical protein